MGPTLTKQTESMRSSTVRFIGIVNNDDESYDMYSIWDMSFMMML